MTKQEFESKIWEYYLMLEENFYFTFKYVEPCDENNMAYSKEYSKLLLSICSEIDIVCKELCKIIENKSSEEVSEYNMKNYREIISVDNNFLNENNTFLKTNEVLQPWQEWGNGTSPEWWKNYNSLKHDRLSDCNYKLGNYQNVKNAIAGLYILCRILYKKQFSQEPFPSSILFKMNNWEEYKEIAGSLLAVKRPNGNIGFVMK